jgi:Uma2 family endonuclease
MSALAKLAPSRMTVAEFIAWPGDGSPARYELVDGELRAMAPASVTHGIIQANLARLLGNHLAGTPCHVVIAPGIIPRLRAAFNFRIPDLAVNCVPDKAAEHALPDPVLVVEILSPSNESETRENVWAYASIPTVREILLLRSTDVAAELLRRQEDESWPEHPEAIGAEGAVNLASIDFTALLASFYAGTYLTRS